MKILIKNAKALLYDDEQFHLEETDIYIVGDKIAALGKAPVGFEPEETIDGTDKVVMPGLINMHTHHYMSLFRNVANDSSFDEWLQNMFLREEALTTEDMYWGTMLSIMESLRTGTTCFNDMYIKFDGIVKAVNDAGIRATVGMGVSDIAGEEIGQEKLDTAVSHIENWQGYNLIDFTIDPHAPYTCSDAYYKKCIEQAKRLKVGIHTHLSEGDNEMKLMAEKTDGKTPIEYAKDIGLFELPTIAAHCVKTNENDWKIMIENNVSVVTNPASNMKLGNGFAPVRGMLDAGVNVCLGTDGPASNNTVNMFREMAIVGLLGKGLNQDSQAITANEVLRMATVNAAKALGKEDEIGQIKVGFAADLAIVDLKNPQLQPYNDILSSLVYSSYGDEVDTVIVAGNILMKNKKFTQMDEEMIYSECAWRAKRLRDAIAIEQ